jgi:hypothetical protein
MSRFLDWSARLPKAIWAWNAIPHEFGKADCVVMGRDVMLKIGAADPLPNGITWSTPIGAARAVKKMGGIPAQLARVYSEIDIACALGGDVLALDACDRAPLGAVWILSAGTAWTMQEGDAHWAGGLVGTKIELLAQTSGLRAFDTGGAL